MYLPHPPFYSLFAKQSFCCDGLRHTQIHNKQKGSIILPPLLMWEDKGHRSASIQAWISASLHLYAIFLVAVFLAVCPTKPDVSLYYKEMKFYLTTLTFDL